MLRRWLSLIVVLMLFVPLLPIHAQEAAQAVTESGRLRLEMPAGWVVRTMPEEEELQGLDSETLVIGTSQAVIDQYLSYQAFDGTVMFISAYPYQIYSKAVLGLPADMMTEVTTYDREEITQLTFAGFPAAEFLYTDSRVGAFIWEIIFDTGEITYRATAYSTQMTDYDVLVDMINAAVFTPIDPAAALAVDQPTRTVQSRDGRLSFEIGENWLYWDETLNALSFASSGKGYADLSYAFQPTSSEEVAVLAQRFIKSALRDGEVNADGSANLPAIAARVQRETGALVSDKPARVVDWQGVPRLDLTWLVPGTTGTIPTRTVLLDGVDVVYFIQAQYADTSFLPLVTQIFDRMQYTAPAAYADPTEVGLEPGQRAPEFTLPLLEGDEASLSEYQGKVILMNMWASWCGPCHMEAPFLQDLYEAYDGRFEILAVNVGESAYEANGFTLRYALSFPILLDDNEEVARLYNLTAYPTTYVIGRDGVVLDVIRGSFTEQGLRDLLALYVGK